MKDYIMDSEPTHHQLLWMLHKKYVVKATGLRKKKINKTYGIYLCHNKGIVTCDFNVLALYFTKILYALYSGSHLNYAVCNLITLCFQI